MFVADPANEDLAFASVTDPEVTAELAVDGGVVVGDDGSFGASAALRWAAEDAARRGTTLHVVRCWSLRTAPRPASWKPGYVPPLHHWEAAVRDELHQDAIGVAELAEIEVQWHTVHQRADEVLVRATADADLVVVGSRGHGQLHELLLGSVATHLIYHAQGPVVVVRTAHRTGRNPR